MVILREDTLKYANKNIFFYFDPPYKPISETSSFNSYAKDSFNDKEQIRLKEFCDKVHGKGATWMLSNSDVAGNNCNNDFFDRIFHKYKIDRVLAKRSINSKASNRGKLTEILINNF